MRNVQRISRLPIVQNPSAASRRLGALASSVTYPRKSHFATGLAAKMPLLTQNLKDRVILGTMTFGPEESSGARLTSLDDYNQCLDYFQKQGYNEIDTARVYIGGKQEAWTRDAKWKDRGLTLATKVHPIKAGGHSAPKVKEALNTSLKELGTDSVDIYYLRRSCLNFALGASSSTLEESTIVIPT